MRSFDARHTVMLIVTTWRLSLSTQKLCNVLTGSVYHVRSCQVQCYAKLDSSKDLLHAVEDQAEVEVPSPTQSAQILAH